MSETKNPGEIIETTPDVVETAVQAEVEISEIISEPAAPAAEKVEFTLEGFVESFKELVGAEDRMSRAKEAESIKSSFYKLLGKLKSEATEAIEGAGEVVEDAKAIALKKFEPVEEQFKAIYADYRHERAEFNKQQDAEREENLVKKQAVLEELRALVDSQEELNTTFPKFREIQAKWREIGPVPAASYRDVNDNYQYLSEKFYDMVKINRDLRDLDFKKNLEAKQAFCEAAEKLAENENIVNAFHELQKLHEQWKEFGPVAKEYREDIWNRFKVATAVINKKYQAHFEDLKSSQADNLTAKTALCEQVEAIAEKEVTSSNEWNALTKEIEEIQKKWKGIGFASKKENQKIYDRFRAACDKFFERKRLYYNDYKDSMNENLDKKMALIAQAEELKNSTEWKKATDQFIELQKQWKEIGAVPRKKSEQLWKRFRAACDEFFAEREKNAKPENNFYANLKAKKQVLEEIAAYVISGDETADTKAANEFIEKWNAIGFVPFKEKESIAKAFRDAMSKFPSFGRKSGGRAPKVLSAKEALIQKYNTLQQDIVTYENNIGFFAASKNSEPLIKQMQERIDAAKAELKELEAQIRKSEEEQQ